MKWPTAVPWARSSFCKPGTAGHGRLTQLLSRSSADVVRYSWSTLSCGLPVLEFNKPPSRSRTWIWPADPQMRSSALGKSILFPFPWWFFRHENGERKWIASVAVMLRRTRSSSTGNLLSRIDATFPNWRSDSDSAPASSPPCFTRPRGFR